MSALSTHVPWTVSTGHKVFNKSFYIMEGQYVSKKSIHNFNFWVDGALRGTGSWFCFLCPTGLDPPTQLVTSHNPALFLRSGQILCVQGNVTSDLKLSIWPKMILSFSFSFLLHPPNAEITSMTTTPSWWAAGGWTRGFIYSRQAYTNWATSPAPF